MWSRILKLRRLARNFIHCRVGSGSHCSFWHDNWTGLGPLSSLLSRSEISSTGIRYEASIQEATYAGQWRISTRSRNPVKSFLRDVLPSAAHLLHPEIPDSYHWMYPGDDTSSQTHSRFSASRTFFTLFPPPPEVSWHKAVWFSGRIPKHTFMTWLAVHDRLATKDRIRWYSSSTDPLCLLCSSHDESRDHLFFTCPYSYTLLRTVLHMIPIDCNLLSLLQWLPRPSSIEHLKLIAHLLLQATIYFIWRERNTRLHTNKSRSIGPLARDIQSTIKSKLLALLPSSTRDSPSLLESWFGLQTHTQPFRFLP